VNHVLSDLEDEDWTGSDSDSESGNDDINDLDLKGLEGEELIKSLQIKFWPNWTSNILQPPHHKRV